MHALMRPHEFSWSDHTCRKCASIHSSPDVGIRLPSQSHLSISLELKSRSAKALSFASMSLLANGR
ncbi:hypothetical protein M405DRAFT_813190 [Rhizopogon salebrosus TDB-379]|nr:hypothetical protein M405DRAFT_813190 [Rhizopogon salebrosus TDB-379]